MGKVKPIPFRQKNGDEPFNASGVVPVGPRRFVFVDNNDPTALFELTFDADLTEVERIHRRRLAGPGQDDLRDPEGLARVDADGETFLVVCSSLCAGPHRAADGLVRVRYRPDGDLSAEAMDGFGGLNVEGLAWDPGAGELLFGLRGPACSGRVTVVRVPVDAGAARWTTASLGTPVVESVRVPGSTATQGIRDLSRDPRTGDFLLLLGRSASHGDAPFQLGTWHRGDDRVRLLDVAFHRTAKPEGVTTFASGGERRILVVDDTGGYAVL